LRDTCIVVQFGWMVQESDAELILALIVGHFLNSRNALKMGRRE
jgi:hypothetical protein